MRARAIDKALIQTLYDYNWWANRRLLEALEKLSPEQLTRNLGNSFPSLRDTAGHILGAEWIWLERWNGRSPTALPAADALAPSALALKTRWAELRAHQQAFIEGLTEDRLAETIAYLNTKGERWQYPLWQLMLHLVNHSTYHRGQVTTMLRQIGAQPASTDLLLYYDRRD